MRAAAAVLAVCFGLTPAEGAAVRVCPTHYAGAGALAHAANGLRHAGALAPGAGGMRHAGAHGSAPADGRHGSGGHGCRCPGVCATAGVVALPAPAPAPDADVFCAAVPLPCAPDITSRGVDDHFLPFPAGPPSSR